MLENKTYDILKWVDIYLLPALAIAYTGLAKVWNIPFATEIPTTITIAQVFIASVLGISTAEYSKRLNA